MITLCGELKKEIKKKNSNKAITAKWNICISESGLTVRMIFTAPAMQEAPSCSLMCSSEFFTHLMCKHLFDGPEIPRQDCRNSYHVLYRKAEVLFHKILHFLDQQIKLLQMSLF